MQFTTKHLLVFTGLIAVIIAVVNWVDRSRDPNPASERFTLLGSPFSPQWEEADRKELDSALVAARLPFVSSDGHKGNARILIDQELFSYEYDDFFGSPAFGIKFSISGHASDDWSDYYLLATPAGGGNIGSSAEISTHFDSATRSLSITIHQQLKNMPDAKVVTILLQWNGVEFVAKTDTEPRDAHGVGGRADFETKVIIADPVILDVHRPKGNEPTRT